MSGSRRPSVSIYDYPEHLNPFSDDMTGVQPAHHLYRDTKTKDSKHKFWTFGKSRKKRSNSFSIKSTWNGLFGKRKEDKPEVQEKRSTITTVSSTYKREPYTKPTAPNRTTDQQEFDEALGTLARRRKYTLDNSPSRYSSSLTVNGDLARLYDGSPQDTTTSIMGDLTPKPPARRFGQVSPKPTDKIPPLDYDGTSSVENGTVTLRERVQENTPIPPLRRFGNRSSQKTNANVVDMEEEANRSVDVALCDENENVPGQYVFKRCSQDPVRQSNLSINSCISVGSTMSSYGRKKRRAPQPPRRPEPNEKAPDVDNVELRIVEPIDIARVAENIDEMTRQSQELSKEDRGTTEGKDERVGSTADNALPCEIPLEENLVTGTVEEHVTDTSCVNENGTVNEGVEKREEVNATKLVIEEPDKEDQISEPDDKSEEGVRVEYRRASQENIEVIKDVDHVNTLSELDDVCLRRNSSSGMLSRSDSFSVKDEIEKIEKQIKALETRNASKDTPDDTQRNSLQDNVKLSIHENRKHFFQNMVAEEHDKGPIKIEFKKFPREQKDIHVVRLSESPVSTVVTREPVKVVELHISEPIRQKPEILEDVNPIPKPRRHSVLTLNDSLCGMSPKGVRKSLESTRGKSF